MDERLDEAQGNAAGRHRLDVREGTLNPQVLGSSPRGVPPQRPWPAHWPGPFPALGQVHQGGFARLPGSLLPLPERATGRSRDRSMNGLGAYEGRVRRCWSGEQARSVRSGVGLGIAADEVGRRERPGEQLGQFGSL